MTAGIVSEGEVIDVSDVDARGAREAEDRGEPVVVGALTAVTLGASIAVASLIVAARLLSLLGVRNLALVATGGAALLAFVCAASLGRRDIRGLRIARPTRPEWALVVLALVAGWLIASRTFDLSFFAPTTFTVDAAHHAGLVNWMVDRGSIPNGFQPELTSFSDYPLWGHVVPALVSSVTGLQPITTLWLMALVAVVVQWPLTAIICRGASPRRSWAGAAVPMLLMLLTWRFTIGLATWDFFFAQLVSLFMAVAGVAFITAAEAVSSPIRRWVPAAAVFAAAALFTYPQQAIIVPVAAAAALATRKYARRPSGRAITLTLGLAAVAAVGVTLLLRSQNYLTPGALLGAGEGSVTQPSMRTLGGWLPAALGVLGGIVLVGRARRRDGASGAVVAAALAPTLLGLGLWAAQNGILVSLDVTSYRITKNIYSAAPFVAVLGALAVVWAFERRDTPSVSTVFGSFTILRSGRERIARGSRIGVGLAVSAALIITVASRPRPLTGVRIPLVTRDAAALGVWARDHLDVTTVGIVGPGLEPYTLWFAALLRPVPTDPPGLDASSAVSRYLRGPAPDGYPTTLAATRWAAWPAGAASERYLLVSGLPFISAYLERPGVSVVRRQGNAAILERSAESAEPVNPVDPVGPSDTTNGGSGPPVGEPEQGVEGLP